MNTDKSVNVLLDNIRDLIARNKLAKALLSMKTLLNEHRTSLKAEYNECLHLSSNYHANEEKVRKGVNDDYDKNRNKFIISFLALTDLIEQSLKQSPELNRKLKITIEIEADFETFAENELLQTIQRYLKAGDDNIKIIDKREGSVLLEMEIDADLLSKLMALIKLGLIKDVRKVKILNEAWSTYMKTKEGMPLLLQNTDLREANLIKANLIGANLIGADFRGAKLIKAKLIKAKLNSAKLIRAKLRGADLSRADLSRADLSGADLSRAKLKGAKLKGAKLNIANLIGAKLNRADLSEAKLSGAKLNRANLGGADLREAYLGGADLREAYLGRADLREAKLNRADLRGADLNDSIFHISEREFLISQGIDVDVVNFVDDGDTKGNRYSSTL